MSNFISHADAAIFRFINSGFPSPLLDQIMLIATMVGVGVVQAGMSLGLILLGLLMDKINLRRAGYAGLAAFAASGIAVQIGKFMWDRPRPLLVLFNVRVVDEPLFTHSYPSGHTTTAFAVMVACSMFLPKFRYVLIPLAFATAISRVYLGVHYPLDVMYGALIGTLVGVMSARWFRPHETCESAMKETQASAAAD